MEEKFKESKRGLEMYLRVKKVLRKTNSKVWKQFKEGDIIRVSMPLVDNSGYRGAKQVYAQIYKITGDIIESLGQCSMKNLEEYLSNSSKYPYFELEDLGDELFDRVKSYCEHYCLTGRSEEDICKTCPLSCQSKIY